MRKIHVSSKVYLSPSADYSKITKASEKAAGKVQYLIDSRMCSTTSFGILCSNYGKFRDAAEKVFNKSVSNGMSPEKARKEYQRALNVIDDTLGDSLSYYAAQSVIERGEQVGKIGDGMKKSVYAGHLPSVKWVDGVVNDIEGVRDNMKNAGIKSGNASRAIEFNVKRASRIRGQLEKYTAKLSK